MYIRRLELFNFGVYAGKNEFVFTSNKPVVLIGGMNGHGKTTFLEAILLSLYGSNSPAYKEQKKTYGSYLKSFVNKSDGTLFSYVLLDFEVSPEERYEIKRLWTGKKQCEETICVKRNGEDNPFLASNWAMFVENILPNALSKFFFFDGEKIAEMSTEENDSQVKESIKALLGINVLDTLENDLSRNLKKNKAKDGYVKLEKEIDSLKEKKEVLENQCAGFQEKLQIATQKELEIRTKIEELRHQYAIQGGDAINKRQDLIQDKAIITSEFNAISEKLIGIASSSLPLALVEDMLCDIKLQAIDDKYDRLVRESVKMIEDKAVQYISNTKTSGDSIRGFIDYLKQDVEEDFCDIYGLSDHAIYQLNQLTEDELRCEKVDVASLINNKSALNDRLLEITSYLSLDINERELKGLLSSIDKEEERLEALREETIKIGDMFHDSNLSLQSVTSELNRKVETYLSEVETNDDDARRKKYSNIAILILDKYKIELQKNKTERLANTITECYKQLANKKNLINRIEMDPATLDLIYLSSEGEEIQKGRLSAGEKQLVVISTLWALAICSKKKLPVIIDTPLARLDSRHREALVKTYFPNASDQTMILSTDSEINAKYYDMMKESVGDEFTLEYNEKTRSTTVKKGYDIGGIYAS